MRIGIALAQLGRQADPAVVRACAQAAETLGYRTVWVLDRLLSPIAPRRGYGGVPGVPPPEEHATSLDPLATLSFAAACTERVGLGVDLPVAPWYPPMLLGRALTGIDVLSAGRLTVGLGLGWSPAGDNAVGRSMTRLTTAQEATFDVFEAIWSEASVEHMGIGVPIRPSTIDPKPVQRPRPPILLTASSPAGLERVARRADGWMPTGVPFDEMATSFASVRDRAASYGRDPDRLELVVRANVSLRSNPLRRDRPIYYGSVDQVVDDLVATQAAGAHEVFLNLAGDCDLDVSLEAYATLADGLALRTAAA